MNEEAKQPIVIVDIKMPFWSMVTFMVKFAIATIPAAIILYAIGFCFYFFLRIAIGTGHH